MDSMTFDFNKNKYGIHHNNQWLVIDVTRIESVDLHDLGNYMRIAMKSGDAFEFHVRSEDLWEVFFDLTALMKSKSIRTKLKTVRRYLRDIFFNIDKKYVSFDKNMAL